MAEPSFRRFRRGRDDGALIQLLTSEAWPLRLHPTFTPEAVQRDIDAGEYDPPYALTYLIELGGEVVGLVRLEDVADNRTDPQLDIRVRSSARQGGLGAAATRFITDAFFEQHPQRWRIEGQTRRDNLGMRKTFVRAGWVKEAVYREAWSPNERGERLDGIGYAITRSDWEARTATRPDFSDP